MPLSPSLRRSLQDQFNRFKDDVIKYGIETGASELPCIRVKNRSNKKYWVSEIEKPFYPYVISWSLENDCLPPETNDDGIKLELSHCCLTLKKKNRSEKSQNSNNKQKRVIPNCVQPDHIELVSHEDNMDRSICQNNLQKYLLMNQTNQHTKEQDKISSGPFYIKDIPSEIRKVGIKAYKEQGTTTREYVKKVKKSKRLKDRAKGKKKKNQSQYVISCTHVPRCFINMHKCG